MFVIYVLLVVYAIYKDVENAMRQHLELIKLALVYYLDCKYQENVHTNVYSLILCKIINANALFKKINCNFI
jgi:hypothetical protein